MQLPGLNVPLYLEGSTTDTISLLSSFYAVLFHWYCMLVLLLRVWMDFLIFYHASIPPAPCCPRSELAYSYLIWYTFRKMPYCKKKKRRTVVMRKPCVSWAEPAQRLQAQKLICCRGAHLQTHAQFSRGCWRRSCSAAYAHLVGARTHSSAEELIFKRHGPPVLADDRRYVIMFYIFSALSRCLKTSPSTSNHKEYARLHGPHSQCGEF